MDITYKTSKRGGFVNRVAMVEGVRVAIFLATFNAEGYTISFNGDTFNGQTFPTVAEAKAAVVAAFAEFN